MRINQALARYHEIERLSREIERALQTEDIHVLSSLYQTMNTLQEEVKESDREMIEQRQSRADLRDTGQLEELLHLMRAIAERNQRLLPRISSIMAVQRDEMRKLSTGNTLLKGYRTVPLQSGGRISSSN